LVSDSYCFAEALRLGCFYDRSSNDRRLMTAAPALIAPVATPIHKTMLLLSASRTVESIGPTGFLEGCLALFFGAVQLKELRQ
jgi:hypothetical protein